MWPFYENCGSKDCTADFVAPVSVRSANQTSFHCSFTLNSSFTVAASNSSGEQGYNLNVNKTFIALAIGPLSTGLIKWHTNQGRN